MKDLKFSESKNKFQATYLGNEWVTLEADAEWFIAGALATLQQIQDALPPGCVRMRDGRLRLKFNNEVGRFAIPGLGVIELRSYKCGEEHFNAMLADIARVAAALPFAPRLGAGVSHRHEHWAEDQPKYHAFVYLRQILSEIAPAEERLSAAIAAILAEPHERLAPSERFVPAGAARDLSARALRQIITGQGVWQRGLETRPGPWQRVAGDAAPQTIPERCTARSRDTAENRFVKHFLIQARAIVVDVRTRVGARANKDSFLRRIDGDGAIMLQGLDELLRAPLWREVGVLQGVPLGSVVLQRRRGYADVLRHDTRLRCLADVAPLTELWRDLMAVKHISRLYELWCFIMVVEVLIIQLGVPQKALVTAPREFDASLSAGLAVTWANGIEALYNPTFVMPGHQGAHRSYSVKLMPDVCVVLPSGPAAGLFVFDAKFALDVKNDDAKSRDLHKMHVYRDALRIKSDDDGYLRVRSAWVLFPGERKDVIRWPAEAPQPAHLAGIGAIPLLPGAQSDGADSMALAEIIGAITGAHAFPVPAA